jgi:hypothetical protein
MTPKQETIIALLQDKLRRERNIRQTLPEKENNGIVFVEVQGVTVAIGKNGGIDIPSVRTYCNPPLDAAARADILFREQHERDENAPERAGAFKTGHLGPRVSLAGRCDQRACHCWSSTAEVENEPQA